MNQIIKILFSDILKNKIVIVYTVFLAALVWSSFALENNSAKGMLTVLGVVLFAVPLVSILFSTIYVYNSNEFIELILSQPIRRNKIWISLFSSLSLAMITAFLIGAAVPILIYSPNFNGLLMIIVGVLITLVFISLAFLCAIFNKDKARGIGSAIMVWLFFALLFDGIVLFFLYQFSDYPIEKPMIFLTSLNPIDLSRIFMLLHLEAAAMMNYTGALFHEYFGSTWGAVVSFILLLLWIAIPFLISLKKFVKKDL
ncbi:MAG: ABC transporter permease [Flavobacteriaceae bacterium]|jgi:Cu-processing system permease protein|nr:ABC transporter permease [Flavobacteriaceae bacterium]